MLAKVQLKNYRCFESSEISFRDLSIVVGQNNAGKSSIVEALRLIALAGRKSKTATKYTIIPKGFGAGANYFGFYLNLEKQKIDIKTAVYFYKEDVAAEINAEFSDKSRIKIFIKEEYAFACLFDQKGINIRSRVTVINLEFDTIAILPQIGLIKEKERRLNPDRVSADKDTYLTSRHFRNEVFQYKKEYFEEFRVLAEETWHRLKIYEIKFNAVEDEYLDLLIQDMGFPAEIGLMGSGIQMWLQIIWFICRSRLAQTIILDEPDVYMHPDMQKKILFILKQRFKQIIIATHSVEIIASVEPRSIVSVDRETRKMKYANSSTAVQRVIDGIGSIHNIALLRIAISKKCVFVEGDDLKILSKFQMILYPELTDTVDSLPAVSLGGFSRYSEAFGAARLFFDENTGIKTFCLLDRDYYPAEYFNSLEEEASVNHLTLHVWKKKEIESYILVPTAIFRSVKLACNYDDFLTGLTEVIDGMRDDVLFRVAAKMYDYFRKTGLDMVSAQEKAATYIKENWTTIDKKIALVNGKDLLSRINEWLRAKYCVSTSLERIINNMKPDEVDDEIIEVLCLFCGK